MQLMKPIILAGDKNQDGQGGVSGERMVGKCGEVWTSVGEGGMGKRIVCQEMIVKKRLLKK